MNKKGVQRTIKPKCALFKKNDNVLLHLMPDSDKYVIMEWLLMQPYTVLREVSLDETKAMFISQCAQLLIDNKVEEFFAVRDKVCENISK